MKFYIVDAFSSVAFGGNPAGVICIEKDKDFPTEDVMIKTAAELRYSETAFVKTLANNEFNIRYFTPCAEVDLCGHATIAAFVVLKKRGVVQDGQLYHIHTKSGIISIHIEESYIFMDMPSPHLLGEISSQSDVTELYKALGIKYETVITESSQKVFNKLLPKIISTGLPDIILPVLNLETLALISPNIELLKGLSSRYNVTGVHAFALTLDDPEVIAHTRNFSPLFGIDEEAATGTASGGLAHYLQESGIVSESDNMSFLQGEHMKRPSKIIAKTYEKDGEKKIKIGGTGIILAEGNIFI